MPFVRAPISPMTSCGGCHDTAWIEAHSGHAWLGVDEDHALGLARLPEVELQQGAGVLTARGPRDPLGGMDVAQRHVREVMVDGGLRDGERLTDLMASLDLGWKERRTRELALMTDLVPLLKQRANGQRISGLSGYEK